MQTFVLAGGCYWCTEAAYRALRGVTQVVAGYTGGTTVNPTYEQIGTGTSGHAEAIAVTFNPDIIPADTILDAYFTMHDPRQVDRQGDSIGTQYRSAMFPADDTQRELFTAARDRAADVWDGEIVTQIEALETFYPAEEYHQDYFAKNPEDAFCLAVTLPKVNKVRAAFREYLA